MRKLICLIFLLFSFVCKAQTNLVPNGNFEYFTACNALPESAPPWYDPTGNSSDYLNSCEENNIWIYSVPHNIYGFQNAHSGKAYALLCICIDHFNYREYIATTLLEPLQKDKKYCFEMYVSLADISEYSINNIGIFFSNGPIDTTGQGLYIINFTPQISSKNIITDTVNWVLIEGSFIASGGEDHLTIGCFVPDDSVSYTRFNNNGQCANYYLDDVSLYECVDTVETTSLFIPDAFTPNGDGVNDMFKVHGQNIKTITGKIINRWGQELYKWSTLNEGWDGKYKGKDVSEGTYFYVISFTFENGEIQEKTGSLELTR